MESKDERLPSRSPSPHSPSRSPGRRVNFNLQRVDVGGVGVRAQILPLKLQGEIAVATQRSRARIEVVQECGRVASIRGGDGERFG